MRGRRRGVPTRLTVAVAEDHPVFRRQLVIALEQDADVEIVAEGDDLASLLPRLRARPDMALVDASVPGGDAARAFGRAAGLDLAVVAMLGPTDDPLLPILAGASGAVAKVDLLRHGPELLRLAATGVPLLDAATGLALLAAAHQHGLELSPGQAEVLHQLAAGRDLIELAGSLGRGPVGTLQDVIPAIMEVRAAAGAPRRSVAAPGGPDGPLPSRQ